MSRNAKYVKKGILSGELSTWEELFDLYKITNLADDLHTRVDTLRTKAADIEQMKIGDIKKIAKLMGMNFHDFETFVLNTSSDPALHRKK